MGGRRPASPQIVPSQPPAGMIGGGPSIFGRFIGSAGRGKKRFKSGRRRRRGEPQRPPTMNFPRTIIGRGGRPAPIGYSIGRADKPIKDIGVGGGPGIPPRFPIGSPKRPKGFQGGDRPSIMPIPPRRPRKPVQRPIFPFPKDDLGPAPEREIPLPKERLPKITRESDPRGPAPFAPDEKNIAKERFFERMFEKADSKRQESSMRQEERGRVNQSRRDETKMRMSEPGEIDINAERRGGRKRRKRPRRMSRDDRAIFRNKFAERLRRR